MTDSDDSPGPDGRDLMISGGGSTLVATDVVLAEVATLRLVRGEAVGWQEDLRRVRLLGVEPAPGWQSGDLGACVFTAAVVIDRIEVDSRELADSLVDAAERYGRLETSLDAALRSTGSWLGHLVGSLRPLAPLVALSLATPLAYLAAGSLLANAVLGRGVSVVPPAVAEWVQGNPRLLTNPGTVALLRVLASSVDDAALGGLGVPYPVAAALGDDGAGILGAPASAFGLLVAARAAGMLRETPVRVQRVAGSAGALARPPAGRRRPGSAGAARGGSFGGPVSAPSPGPVPVPSPRPAVARGRSPAAAPGPVALPAPHPPAGFADLAERIPIEADGGQVRIERYGDPGQPTWLVYIGGTLEWSPTGSTEPWDMTSNVTAVADRSAGSYRAVLQALREAGVQPGDPVVPVAHSQGGLIAAELAARGDVDAVGLVTFGAPAGQVAVPADLPAIAVEHADDIIPALGGTAAADDGRLYVRREMFADTELPPDEPLPAHRMSGYRDTAELVDASAEPRLVAFREHLGRIVGTAPGEQSVWRGERVPERAPG
jgi:hypothetical protein